MGLRGERLEASPQPRDGVARDEHDEHARGADVAGSRRTIDGCRGHEVRPEAARSLARRCSNTRKGGHAPLPSTNGDPTATASSRSASSPAYAPQSSWPRSSGRWLPACGLPARRLPGRRLARGGLPSPGRLLRRDLALAAVVFLRRSSCAVWLPSSPQPCAWRRPPSSCAVAFLAATLRLAVVFLAAVLRFAVDLFFAGDIGHPLSIGLRTPCASGVAVRVRSSLPTPRTARRGEGRS